MSRKNKKKDRMLEQERTENEEMTINTDGEVDAEEETAEEIAEEAAAADEPADEEPEENGDDPADDDRDNDGDEDEAQKDEEDGEDFEDADEEPADTDDADTYEDDTYEDDTYEDAPEDDRSDSELLAAGYDPDEETPRERRKREKAEKREQKKNKPGERASGGKKFFGVLSILLLFAAMALMGLGYYFLSYRPVYENKTRDLKYPQLASITDNSAARLATLTEPATVGDASFVPKDFDPDKATDTNARLEEITGQEDYGEENTSDGQAETYDAETQSDTETETYEEESQTEENTYDSDSDTDPDYDE